MDRIVLRVTIGDAVKVEAPWTKERLRALGDRALAYASEQTVLMHLEDRPDTARAWGLRLPRIKAAITAAAKLPYETGEAADAIGEGLVDLMREPASEPPRPGLHRQQLRDFDPDPVARV